MNTVRPRALICAAREWDKLVAHVCRAYPEEGCGILLGESGDTDGLVYLRMVLPTANGWQVTAERHRRFVIPPESVIFADRLAARAGWEIIGFYHSHPDQPATPSAFDADATWEGTFTLILSVRARQLADARAWWKSLQQAEFLHTPIMQCD
ncbi:MAG: Mov34/MPN/PAD-1 family protein [Thermoflexales bacterium]